MNASGSIVPTSPASGERESAKNRGTKISAAAIGSSRQPSGPMDSASDRLL